MAFRRRAAKAPEGRIQVRPYSGRPIVDPSPAELRDLVLAVDPDELIVVAASADLDGTYIQTLCRSDGQWVVEARDGTEGSHAHVFVPDVRAAADLIGLWAAADPAWRTAVDWGDGNGA